MTASEQTFARTLLDTAAQVEAAEDAIKKEILRAADAGDCARVASIVTRWIDMPSVEVLDGPARICGIGLDPCEEVEVIVSERGAEPRSDADGRGAA
jgi:hypothetical protein